ncbi:unnamed protein product [Coccothraustes coccothraustes]
MDSYLITIKLQEVKWFRSTIAMFIKWRVHTALSTCRSISSAVRMHLSIWTAVLLGLVLTPALADYFQQFPGSIFNNTQVIIGGQSQIVTINRQWRVAVIEQRSFSGSWKTIWNYNTGVIATKVPQENTCYISIMNRDEMPSFDNLARLAEESRNLIGSFGSPTTRITYVTNGLVSNLYSYGIDITAMCSGLTTYMAYEVSRPQLNLGSCITLDVLRAVELQYCNSNGSINFPEIPSGIFNNTQVIFGGQSQIVTINSQWRVAVIEQRNISGSWKTIWNYNTGIIATKLVQQNICYISVMNKNEMPSFENLAYLASQNGNHPRPPAKEISFSLIRRAIRDLESYGPDIFSMCRGLSTYVAYEDQGPQFNLGSCLKLDVLQYLALTYCHNDNFV